MLGEGHTNEGCPRYEIAHGESGFLFDDGHLIVAADDAPCQFDAFSQLLGSQGYHLLRWIVDQPAPGLGKLPSVSLHCLSSRGADHSENRIAPHVKHRELRGGDRRPRIKTRDLITRKIG